MYYIVRLDFPNGNTVTVTVVAISEGDAVKKARLMYPEAIGMHVVGSHVA